MPAPEDFFIEQFELVEAFLVNPDKSVLRIEIDPEMERMPLRYFEAKDRHDDFKHLFLHHDKAFLTPVAWTHGLLTKLDEEIETNLDVLVDAKIDVDGLMETRFPEHQPWKTLLARAEALARDLAGQVGSFVVFLTPDTVRDPKGWGRTMRYFADQTRVSELKFIVYDMRTDPALADLAEHPKVATQCFWLSPEEIERRAAAEVEASPKEYESGGAGRRRALATLGVMASGRKDYETAERAQLTLLSEAKAAGDPTEKALALYNLGNTYLGDNRPDEAGEVLSQCVDGCLYHELDQLAPMAFCNLGIALSRDGAPDQAYESLRAGRSMFKAQRNLPGEAYACDCLALLHHEAGKRHEAEKAWRYAIKLYNGITNPDLADVKRGGLYDIKNKLKHFGYADG